MAAPNTAPLFTLTPVLSTAQVTTANTNRDGTGAVVTIATGGANGTRIESVTIKAVGTTTAGMVRLYIADLSANIRLITEQTIAAVTPSATVKSEEYNLTTYPFPLTLPTGWTLRASTEKTETFNIIPRAGDF